MSQLRAAELRDPRLAGRPACGGGKGGSYSSGDHGELVHGMHTGDLWPRPGRVLLAARTATFEQLGKAIDDAFARWDHNHLHEFTLADGTVIIPVRRWDDEEPERSLDDAKARLGRDERITTCGMPPCRCG